MPDISMCQGLDCPLKETCYRYTATPSQRQSYFSIPPFEHRTCEYYWEIEKKPPSKLRDAARHNDGPGADKVKDETLPNDG